LPRGDGAGVDVPFTIQDFNNLLDSTEVTTITMVETILSIDTSTGDRNAGLNNKRSY